MDELLYDVAAGVARVTINRPERRNAMTWDVITGLRDACARATTAGGGAPPRLFLELDELGKPTVARVRGFALAGGFGLALSCDLVVAADDATFGTPEVDVGLWPFMITVPLTRA